MYKRVLVLGANGFIGSRVAIKAASRGFEVTGLDRFSGESDFDWHPAINRIHGDARDSTLIEQLASFSEVIIDCLPDSNPIDSERLSPRDIAELERRKILLAQAVEASGGGALYLYMSSGGAVYGDSPHAILSEDDELCPVSAYGRLKVSLETQLRKYFAPQRLLIIRPANLYGVPLRAPRPQGLVDAALKAALDGSTLPLYGDGRMVRDYLHVDDAAGAIVDLIATPPQDSIVNLGSGTGTSVLQAVGAIEKASGKKIVLEPRASPPGFPSTSVLDIARICSLVPNFNPRDFSEGVVQHLGILRRLRGEL